MPESSLHIVKDAPILRILEGVGRRIFAGRKKLRKSREIFHVFVCVSVTMSFHVISHKRKP
jgi:predicted membrane channel-forming protein YqfA (hemolysin III family)